MKKTILTGIACCFCVSGLLAGGLITNDNQSASYFRMLARGASTSGDAVYYNPAGLAFLDDGLTISLNSQMIWMERTLTNDLPTLNTSEFIGKLYVPMFPGVYAAYKTGKWAFSLGFNPPAGGGSVEFADGLPMLEKDVSMIPGMLTGKGIPTTKYSMESMLKGSSIVYGVQAGATYKINDMLSVFGGARMLFASNSYEGYVKNIQINPSIEAIAEILDGEMMNSAVLNAKGDAINSYAGTLPPIPPYDDIANNLRAVAAGLKEVSQGIPDQSLDVKQAGQGITPLLGIHYRNKGLNLAAKYEFNTKMSIKNETKPDGNAMNMYPDGQELRSDVPALLSLAGSYDIIPALTLSVTYMHHFEPQATIESWAPDASNPNGGIIVQRQKLIDSGTNEYMAGLEWKLTNKLTLSTGGQWSDVSVSDAWQNDITHNLDNFTMALGAAYQINDCLTLNIGGLHTWYNSLSIKTATNIPAIPYNTQTYERTNTAIAIGIDYRF